MTGGAGFVGSFFAATGLYFLANATVEIAKTN